MEDDQATLSMAVQSSSRTQTLTVLPSSSTAVSSSSSSITSFCAFDVEAIGAAPLPMAAFLEWLPGSLSSSLFLFPSDSVSLGGGRAGPDSSNALPFLSVAEGLMKMDDFSGHNSVDEDVREVSLTHAAGRG